MGKDHGRRTSPADGDTDQPPPGGVAALVAALRSPATSTRRQAAQDLCVRLIGLLHGHAAYTDGSLGGATDAAGVAVSVREVGTAVLSPKPLVRSATEFHRRAGVYVRGWLCARLPDPAAVPPSAAARVHAWRAVHQTAGVLAEPLRDVFDAMHYGGLSAVDAAADLGRDPAEVVRAVGRVRADLGPLFDAARGKPPDARS